MQRQQECGRRRGAVFVDLQFERASGGAATHDRELGFRRGVHELGVQRAREQHQCRVGAALVADPLATSTRHRHANSIDGSGREGKDLCTLGRVTYAVRVVQIALDLHSERLAAMVHDVPDGERGVRPQVLLARAAVRAVLASALGVEPATLNITRSCSRCGDPVHGKPALEDAPLTFNASHSGDTALVAFGAPGHAIGVDVEAVRPRGSDLDALAARTLTPSELAAWRAHADDARLPAFLSMWTAKEAVLKATGQGIVTDLRAVDAAPAGWTVEHLNVRDGYVASLAVDAPAVVVSFEEWRN